MAHINSVDTWERFKKSETEAYELFKYKWGMGMVLNKDNSHSPKGQTIRGIKYE